MPTNLLPGAAAAGLCMCGVIWPARNVLHFSPVRKMLVRLWPATTAQHKTVTLQLGAFALMRT
jgi:hypothetical protein